MRIGGECTPGPDSHTTPTSAFQMDPAGSRSGESFRGEPAARRPAKAAAPAASRRSACASSGQCSRPPRAARQLSAWRCDRPPRTVPDRSFVAFAIARPTRAREQKQSCRAEAACAWIWAIAEARPSMRLRGPAQESERATTDKRTRESASHGSPETDGPTGRSGSRESDHRRNRWSPAVAPRRALKKWAGE